MNSGEKPSSNEAENTGSSEWEKVDFPDFTPEENTEEESVDVDKLAQELIAARKDAKEGATWDKEQRAYIGEDGLPRDWAHLVGYLKKNPDAIKTATETLDQLRSAEAPAEEVGESEETSNAEEVAEIEETEAEEIGEEAEAKEETELDEQSLSTINYYKEQAKKGIGSPELIMRHFRDNQRKILSKTSKRVQGAFALHEARKELSATQDEVNSNAAKLEEMPRIALPWSKAGREKRELRRKIKEGERKAESLSGSISNYEDQFAKEPLSKKEQATIDAIESMPKYVLQGAEVQKEYWQGRLETINDVEKQLSLPEDKRDWDLIEKVKPHAKLLGDDSVRRAIKEQRDGIATLLRNNDKEFRPLRDDQKEAA